VSLDRIDFLVGTWRGQGRGDYPTIDPFAYSEEVVFGTIPGKDFVTYQQRTKGTDGLPLHAEVGYVRSPAGGIAELVIAQPTGVAEILTGVVEGTSLDLTSTMVGLTPSAKNIRSTARLIEVEGDTLRYRMSMAAMNQPEQFHLEAELVRA
jgi:hypothetical protein